MVESKAQFTLDDVRDYLENTGAIREAEILISGYGKSPGRFSEGLQKLKKGDTLEQTLPKALEESVPPGSFGAIRGMDNVKEVSSYISSYFLNYYLIVLLDLTTLQIEIHFTSCSWKNLKII